VLLGALRLISSSAASALARSSAHLASSAFTLRFSCTCALSNFSAFSVRPARLERALCDDLATTTLHCGASTALGAGGDHRIQLPYPVRTHSSRRALEPGRTALPRFVEDIL